LQLTHYSLPAVNPEVTGCSASSKRTDASAVERQTNKNAFPGIVTCTKRKHWKSMKI
jgi:hypothetical protein